MLGIVIFRADCQTVAQFCGGFDNALRTDVSVVGSLAVCSTEEITRTRCAAAGSVLFGTGQVVNIRCGDTVHHIEYAAKVNQNGVPLRCLRYVIQTTAADISDFRKSYPVINDCHLTGDFSLLHNLI